MAIVNSAHKANHLSEVDQAVRFTEPIGPDHEFYVEFRDVRGDFEERIVYKRLNVSQLGGSFQFDPATSSSQKVLFFLGGMRGSGKTSELAKYSQNLHRPECFFCVTCNIDDELDMNDIEYTDILIFQLEKLIRQLNDQKLDISETVLKEMQRWFSEREKEIGTTIKADTGMEFGYGVTKGNVLQSLFGIVAYVRAGLSGSKQWVNTIRTSFKNRFPDFATRFNDFIEEANIALRKKGIGKEVLFIVDGLEKTMTADLRKKSLSTNRIGSGQSRHIPFLRFQSS
ncbi:MAG: AAA family ATPase [Bacteroidetes bacterium]|nr:AAA family ATPase [Bacteroidota bacterium]